MKKNSFDEFRKKIDALANNVAALDGEHSVPVNDLLTPAFVSRYTGFASLDELFEKSGFKIDSAEDFAAIPDEEWDNYIRSISSFNSWHAMLSKASEAWAAKKLGF